MSLCDAQVKFRKPGERGNGATLRELAQKSGRSVQEIACELRAMKPDAEISLFCAHEDLRTISQDGSEALELCARRPGLWNALAYEREWRTHPEYNNFMDPESPVHHRKIYQGEIYARLLGPQIEKLDSGARVLDLGAGVGRMAPHLARTGARLDLADASERALLHALGVLCGCGVRDFDLHWRDAHDLSCFEDGAFDLVLALELLCYLDEPVRAVSELARVCRPGGVVAYSVESKAGAILGDARLNASDVDALLRSNQLTVPEYMLVNYHTADAAAALAVMAGLKVQFVAGCHYLADGPFDALVSEESLADPQKHARTHEAEEMCRGHEWLRRLARAWFVTAQKPE